MSQSPIKVTSINLIRITTFLLVTTVVYLACRNFIVTVGASMIAWILIDPVTKHIVYPGDEKYEELNKYFDNNK